MPLKVHAQDGTYEFEGPYESADDLKKQSGVYVISTREASGKHKIIDVGESGNIQDRVKNHDRGGQWVHHTVDGLFMSGYYCDEKERMKVEGLVRTAQNPPCGDR